MLPIRKNSLFFRCTHCGLIHYKDAQSVSYESDYFNKEYKDQYGKNYTQDEETIRNLGQKRFKKFFQYASHLKNASSNIKLKRSFLEVGSAAGFFLHEAKKFGFSIEGWEISKEMSEYANQKGILTLNGDFYSLYEKNKNRKFHIIAAFYVMEHLDYAEKFWNNISNLLEKNGYLLISLPNSYGPVFYFNPLGWEKSHPKDHFYDYNPRSLKIGAALFGLKCLYCGPENLHPERFPMGNNIFMKKVYNYIQQKFYFADTIFCIFQKK